MTMHLSRLGWLLLVLLWLYGGSIAAQTSSADWRQLYTEFYDQPEDEDAETDFLDKIALMEQLAEHPLDFNRATRTELEQLPFLSEQQVDDLLAYRALHDGMLSLGELRMVQSLDFEQLSLLPSFIYVDSLPAVGKAPPLGQLLKHARHTLTGSVRLPFYNRRGDRNGYLGYKYRHWVKYEFDAGNRLHASLTGSQDAGEPFMANRNTMGYDLYNYYVQLQHTGPLENLVAGKFRLSAGMGLVLGSSFSLGKQSAMQGLGRAVCSLRPHASRSEADYLQGLATTIRLNHTLRLTLFGSYRAVDATLSTAGAATTLLYSGYHRTPAEMQKKHNTHLTAAGGVVNWRSGGFHAGLNAVWTHLSRPLEPNRSVLYRRYYAHGSSFVNASADYGYTSHALTLNGETATDADGHLAMVNSIGLRLTENMVVNAVYRFYSYRYTSLYAHSFGENSRPQNENGFCLSTTWHPTAHWQLQAYADYAAFAWARYQASRPSHATDVLLQSLWQHRRYSVQLRYRAHLKQKDNADKTSLIASDEHRARLQLTFTPSDVWTLKTQADYTFTQYKECARGYLLAQQVAWRTGGLWLQLCAAGFNTDDYQARIYLSEARMAGDFSLPAYYGRGVHASLMAQTNWHALRFSLRLGHTRYSDREAIGSGLQLIDHAHATDLDLQLRWRL